MELRGSAFFYYSEPQWRFLREQPWSGRALNQRAHRELAPLGRMIGIPFLMLGATLLAAGVGWFRRALWGWRLAVALIAAQVIGNIVNLFLGHIAEGPTGFIIATALLAYLMLPRVRIVFR